MNAKTCKERKHLFLMQFFLTLKFWDTSWMKNSKLKIFMQNYVGSWSDIIEKFFYNIYIVSSCHFVLFDVNLNGLRNPIFSQFSWLQSQESYMFNDYLITISSYLEHCENLYLILFVILVISFSRVNRILFTTIISV